MVIEGFCGKAVSEIGSSSNSFGPEVDGNMRFDHKGSGDFEKSSVFPLGYTILLRCVRASSLVEKTMVNNELFHIQGNVFPPLSDRKIFG